MEGLHNIDGKHIDQKSRFEHEYVQKVYKSAPLVTFSKIVRIINACLDDVIANSNKFVYTRSGIALGNGSRVPHADLTYVWEKLTKFIVGQPPKPGTIQEVALLKGMGAMFQWVVSARPEFWLVKFTPSGKISMLDGREVNIAEYWIGDPARYRKVMKMHTAQDLVNKFNSARF